MRVFLASLIGGTRDSLAWQSTNAYAKLEKDGIPHPYFFVRDDAYGCRPHMVTPFPSTGLTKSRSDFNFYQSKTRITIERAFGVFVSRWGVLRRPLTCSPRQFVSLVRCSLSLWPSQTRGVLSPHPSTSSSPSPSATLDNYQS